MLRPRCSLLRSQNACRGAPLLPQGLFPLHSLLLGENPPVAPGVRLAEVTNDGEEANDSLSGVGVSVGGGPDPQICHGLALGRGGSGQRWIAAAHARRIRRKGLQAIGHLSPPSVAVLPRRSCPGNPANMEAAAEVEVSVPPAAGPAPPALDSAAPPRSKCMSVSCGSLRRHGRSRRASRNGHALRPRHAFRVGRRGGSAECRAEGVVTAPPKCGGSVGGSRPRRRDIQPDEARPRRVTPNRHSRALKPCPPPVPHLPPGGSRHLESCLLRSTGLGPAPTGRHVVGLGAWRPAAAARQGRPWSTSAARHVFVLHIGVPGGARCEGRGPAGRHQHTS
ncbi:hypothetical protein PHYPSEUDO_015110 [Phytophthora pseudosyringae]|uniref:Uncharacterized protein n=1 Tax=Phytophthora pseudosyringae TaxID=221518 RepID=A0A8T1W0B4_9STRA|nr:hypothetical protein PHYPSEUDO_015110 [Phytophthora pseudosyringae]